MTERAAPATPAAAAEEAAARLRAANRRTATLLFAIGAVFFFGFIASHVLADGATGITVIGLAVLLFLVVAIGRNLRSRQ